MSEKSETRIYLKVKHRALRKARGMVGQSAMARVLGVTPQVFAAYEEGRNRVPADVLIAWCAELQLRPASVIVEEDKKVISKLAAAA